MRAGARLRGTVVRLRVRVDRGQLGLSGVLDVERVRSDLRIRRGLRVDERLRGFLRRGLGTGLGIGIGLHRRGMHEDVGPRWDHVGSVEPDADTQSPLAARDEREGIAAPACVDRRDRGVGRWRIGGATCLQKQ